MGDEGAPIQYTIKELEAMYRKHKITYKQLMLYKHRPDKIPVKEREHYRGPDTSSISLADSAHKYLDKKSDSTETIYADGHPFCPELGYPYY